MNTDDDGGDDDQNDIFAVFKKRYAKSGETAEIYDAESRECVRYLICRDRLPPRREPPSWEMINSFWESIAKFTGTEMRGHRCGTPECHPFSLNTGTLFTDPRDRAGPKLRATGHVWMCRYTLKQHICDPNQVCRYTEQDPRSQNSSCAMTAVSKSAMVSTASSALNRDTVRHIDRMTFDSAVKMADSEDRQCAPASSSSSSSGSGGGRKRTEPCAVAAAVPAHADKKAGGKKRKPQHHVSQHQLSASVNGQLSMGRLLSQVEPSAEVREIIGRIFGPNGISAACRECLLQAEQRMHAKVAEAVARGHVGFAELASIVVDSSARELVALLSVSSTLAPTWKTSAADVAYIAECVSRILIILRQTPVMLQNNSAVGSKGARDKEMCVPILGYMRDGCIGRVMLNTETSEAEYIVCTEAAEQHCGMRSSASYKCVARFVFIPAHHGLDAVLPRVLPRSLPENMHAYFSRQMRRNRSRELPFVSVLKTLALDPEQFCLSRYMQPRPDLFIHRAGDGAAE
jgi:hypothetical protein